MDSSESKRARAAHTSSRLAVDRPRALFRMHIRVMTRPFEGLDPARVPNPIATQVVVSGVDENADPAFQKTRDPESSRMEDVACQVERGLYARRAQNEVLCTQFSPRWIAEGGRTATNRLARHQRRVQPASVDERDIPRCAS
jgi:hypothetical protein